MKKEVHVMLGKHLVLSIILSISLSITAIESGSAQAEAGTDAADGVRPDASSLVVPMALPQSSDGIIYDDGNPLYRRGSTTGGNTWMGQRFVPAPYPYRFTQVSTWWTRTGADTDLTYSILIYDNDGTGGAPSTYLGAWGPFYASSVPQWPNGAWYDVQIDFSTLGVDFVYLILEWNAAADSGFYIGTDESGGGVRAPGYYYSSSWNSMTGIAPNYENFYIRADGAGEFSAGYREENHTYFDYNSGWKTVNNAGASGGSAQRSKENASVTFDFLGEVLLVYRRVGPDDGAMQVCIDEVCRIIENKAGSVAWAEPVAFGPYPDGSRHTVYINSTGAKSFYLDAIEVVNLTSIISPLSSGFHNEDSTGFYYGGNWTVRTKALALNGTIQQARSRDAGVMFRFTGTEFSFYTSFTRKKEAITLCIDGECHPVSVNSKHWGLNNSTQWGYKTRVRINGLANSPHMVGLHRAAGSQLWFDGVWVGADAPIE